ncbi:MULTISPECIES: hypothetical protein [Pseudomonas]|uniref:hypothetical protein n=1 Tax=Pseudomonas TaxID=286 RepID=UPI00398FA468
MTNEFVRPARKLPLVEGGFWPFSAGRHYGVCWSGRMQFDWSVTMQMVKSMQLRRLTLKTDERPPGHGKPPAAKVFQRYQWTQESPPKYG